MNATGRRSRGFSEYSLAPILAKILALYARHCTIKLGKHSSPFLGTVQLYSGKPAGRKCLLNKVGASWSPVNDISHEEELQSYTPTVNFDPKEK